MMPAAGMLCCALSSCSLFSQSQPSLMVTPFNFFRELWFWDWTTFDFGSLSQMQASFICMCSNFGAGRVITAAMPLDTQSQQKASTNKSLLLMVVFAYMCKVRFDLWAFLWQESIVRNVFPAWSFYGFPFYFCFAGFHFARFARRSNSNRTNNRRTHNDHASFPCNHNGSVWFIFVHP